MQTFSKIKIKILQVGRELLVLTAILHLLYKTTTTEVPAYRSRLSQDLTVFLQQLFHTLAAEFSTVMVHS
jgi:hypothetical protein